MKRAPQGLTWRAYPLAVFPLLLVGLCLCVPAARPQGTPGKRPQLVVVIVVDQMRADYIQRFRGEWHGGLARLVNQGAWFHNVAYPYLGTETCPGHATISTGVFPATHGIIGNTWWDRQAAKTVTCTEDASVSDRGVDRTATPGDSPSRLLAPSFAERLRAAQPGSRVVTMSLKARAAIMLAGHHADVVLWQDEVAGDWFTSAAYGSGMPAFAREFFMAHPLSADAAKSWDPGLAESSHQGGHSVAGENPPAGWTTSFPHPLAGNEATDRAFVGRWRASPFSDEYLGELAAAAVDSMKLGRGAQTDFLGISFSAPDYIGHAFGPDSREIEEEYLRLDATIGKLLDDFDRAVGAGKYVVVLTADHGVAPVPEQAESTRGGRVDGAGVVASVEKVLTQRLGPGPHVWQVVDQNIYFKAGVMQRIRADAAVWHELQAAILANPGVEDVFQGAELARRSTTDRLQRAAALDEVPSRSGDVMVLLKPYWIFASRGTTHGSANEYDQRVPLVLFGAGIRRGDYAAASSPADIAPTLASLCGLPAARTQGHVLKEALQPGGSTVSQR